MTVLPPAGLESPIDPDRLTLDAILEGGLRDRPITVLGLARSGIALTRFLADAGARVTVYDVREHDQLGPALAAIDGPGRSIRLLLGPAVDPADAWAGADLVTSSPSINPAFPTTEPAMRRALGELVARRERGDRSAPAVIWEPDLFLRLCPAVTIGVTGTKGKTTTSALTHAVLAADEGHRAILGGNMGVPIVERLPEIRPDDRVVFELSELQLPTLSRGTSVAVYTNVTEDHIDRHGSVEAYRRVKRRLAELVEPDGLVVLNLDDPVVASYAEASRARVIGYRLGEPPRDGVGFADGWIVSARVGGVMPAHELRIPGRHNVSNALAAIAVALEFGLAPDRIREAASRFEGVEHRLETVAIVDGIRYVNDSQGTQPDAVAAALRAFPAPVVLIAGGRAKGIDLSALGPVVAERAAAAVLIGESAPDLEALFSRAGLRRMERARTLDVAVERATALAREAIGPRPKRAERRADDALATVLLSPAAASFDMFSDYEARGRAFKAAVADLAQRRSR
jgi:UDP-N-acetylmuramoylalanine--D-glutamate ligase